MVISSARFLVLGGSDRPGLLKGNVQKFDKMGERQSEVDLPPGCKLDESLFLPLAHFFVGKCLLIPNSTG